MISNAYAQAATTGAAPQGLEQYMGMLPIILMFVIMYFIMIRPQMKKAKEHKTMLEALQKGDEVVAVGILGKVAKISDNYVSLEIAPNVTIQVQRGAGDAAPAQGHGQGRAVGKHPHEQVSRLEVRRHRSRDPRERPLRRAESLRRGARGAGLAAARGGQDRQRAAYGARGSVEGREPRAGLRRSIRGDAALSLRGHRHAGEGDRRHQGEGGHGLRGRPEPRAQFPALAAGARRQAHVPGARPARRRALPAAGGHEGGGQQVRRALPRRRARAAARQEDLLLGPRARRRSHRGALPRARPARRGAEGDDRGDARPHHPRAGFGRRIALAREHQARSREARAGPRAAAEHPDAAQPRERAGRGRAHRAAAGRRPHRGAARGRAGSGARQGDPRPHRDPRSAPGVRRARRGPGPGRVLPVQGPARALRHRQVPRPGGPSGAREEDGRHHRRPHQGCAARLRPAARRRHRLDAARRHGRAHHAPDHAREREEAHGDDAGGAQQHGGAHLARDPGGVRQPLPDLRHARRDRGEEPRPAARGGARRADGHHRGAHHRPQPGRREHPEGLPRGAGRLRRDRGLHDPLLLGLRRDLGPCARVQPALPPRHPLDDAGDAHAAGHRGRRPRSAWRSTPTCSSTSACARSCAPE